MYSATEAREDAADAVSQSLSVLLLGLRLRMGKASRDSTLLGKRDGGGAGRAAGMPPLARNWHRLADPTLKRARLHHRHKKGHRPRQEAGSNSGEHSRSAPRRTR